MLLGQIQIAQENLKSAKDQLKERDANIIKLSQDLSTHEEDSSVIEKLKAELEGRAKDADALKKCKAKLARAKKEKDEADGKVALLEQKLSEAVQNEEVLRANEKKYEQEIEELRAASSSKDDMIFARDQENSSLKVRQTELQREILHLRSKADTAVIDYFNSEQGMRDQKQVGLEHVRPFAKKMARKFPTKKVDFKEASNILISKHFGNWFENGLPDTDRDVDFSDCEEFENYHPPGEPESENSSLEDEDEDQEDEDHDE